MVAAIIFGELSVIVGRDFDHGHRLVLGRAAFNALVVNSGQAPVVGAGFRAPFVRRGFHRSTFLFENVIKCHGTGARTPSCATAGRDPNSPG
jgi:hypothetical protein